MSRALLLFPGLLLGLGVPGCRPAPPPQSRVVAIPGRDVRYNAVLALAHRGSARIREPAPWAVLRAMLDERSLAAPCDPQAGGPSQADTAWTSLIAGSALRAVRDLHRKNPALDLGDLRDLIDTLTHSDSPGLAAEARKTHAELFHHPD